MSHPLGVRALFIALFLVLAPLPAFAGRKRALELYEEGTVAYNLRSFEDAISKYEAAYKEFPAPEFLFNIAQAYRQLDDCEKAVHFYKRYLALRPDAKEKEEVAARIADLEARCKDKKVVQERPPDGTQEPPKEPPKEQPKETLRPPDPQIRVTKTATVAPAPQPKLSVLDIRVEGGVALIDLGTDTVPVQPYFALQLSKRFGFFEPGFRGAYAPIPLTINGVDYPLALIELAPTVSLAFTVVEGLRLRADLAAGLLFVTGADAAITELFRTNTFELKGGVGADLALGDLLFISISPFAYAWTEPQTRIEIAAGLGLRL